MPTPFNLLPSNSSSTGTKPVDEGVKFDKDALIYDMSGEKFLIILNQETFETFESFKPDTRNGTDKDESRLKEVFYPLGFKIIVLKDLKYRDIVDHVTNIASLDHTRTSCICVTILTHGGRGGQIYAADRPYPLSKLIAIFDNEKSLTNKPKLFFVQACRGAKTDAGHTVYLGSQSNSVLTKSTSRQADSSFLGWLVGWLPNKLKNAGSTDNSDSRSVGILTVPTHANRLVLYSTVEGYVSYRHPTDGSWMIQALCDIVQNHHKDLDLLSMITLMNRLVAYEKMTKHKKQMLEANFTLTKILYFAYT